MSVLAIFKRDEAAPESKDLQALLIDMQRYGRPRLSRHDKGWYCCIEMNTNAIGAKFEVASDFEQPSPMTAALMCRDRAEAAIRAIGGVHGSSV